MRISCPHSICLYAKIHVYTHACSVMHMTWLIYQFLHSSICAQTICLQFYNLCSVNSNTNCVCDTGRMCTSLKSHVISLYLCAAQLRITSLSLFRSVWEVLPWCFILRLRWHACLSSWRAKQASPPAAPRSLNQAGLACPGLIGGQNRQHEGSLSGGSDWSYCWDGKKHGQREIRNIWGQESSVRWFKDSADRGWTNHWSSTKIWKIDYI